jgi:hypothetical protein
MLSIIMRRVHDQPKNLPGVEPAIIGVGSTLSATGARVLKRRCPVQRWASLEHLKIQVAVNLVLPQRSQVIASLELISRYLSNRQLPQSLRGLLPEALMESCRKKVSPPKA